MSLWPSSSKIVTRNSSTWDAILTTVGVALQMEGFGISSETNYKFDHIAFSIRPSAFRSLSNVEVKWCTFHVYTIKITEIVCVCVCVYLRICVRL
jgi:hypothetical protein